jgi:hypothetical protein
MACFITDAIADGDGTQCAYAPTSITQTHLAELRASGISPDVAALNVQ